jgi:prepilin-type N-terminal cleavage/methylation domain-containing protein
MKAFTLIETLVVIFVFSVVIMMTGNFIVMGYKTQSYTYQQSIAINEARKGIEVMVKEIREAQTGENGAHIIEDAQEKEFVFYSDVDNDNRVEKVKYFIDDDNNEFKKLIFEPNDWTFSDLENAAMGTIFYPTAPSREMTLCQYLVDAPPSVFAYLNANGEELTELPAIKKYTKTIKVRLLINVNPARAPDAFELSSEASLRNL